MHLSGPRPTRYVQQHHANYAQPINSTNYPHPNQMNQVNPKSISFTEAEQFRRRAEGIPQPHVNYDHYDYQVPPPLPSSSYSSAAQWGRSRLDHFQQTETQNSGQQQNSMMQNMNNPVSSSSSSSNLNWDSNAETLKHVAKMGLEIKSSTDWDSQQSHTGLSHNGGEERNIKSTNAWPNLGISAAHLNGQVEHADPNHMSRSTLGAPPPSLAVTGSNVSSVKSTFSELPNPGNVSDGLSSHSANDSTTAGNTPSIGVVSQQVSSQNLVQNTTGNNVCTSQNSQNTMAQTAQQMFMMNPALGGGSSTNKLNANSKFRGQKNQQNPLEQQLEHYNAGNGDEVLEFSIYELDFC